MSDGGPEYAGKYIQALSDCLCISWHVSRTKTGWDELLVYAQLTIMARQELVQNAPFFFNHGRHPRTPVSASLARGRTLPSQSIKILLLLLMHSPCKPQLHVPKHACSMHSKGRSTTMTEGMSHMSVTLVQKCSLPPLSCI